MARPSLDEAATEDRLSLAVGRLSRAILFLGAVAAHHRMVLRREPALRRFIDEADRSLAAALDEIDGAQEDVRSELRAEAMRRHNAHYGVLESGKTLDERSVSRD